MLTWDNPEKKFYETGLSHGILYVHSGLGVPTGIAWEGLMSVKETPGGSEKTSLWVSNREYAQLISPKTFSGNIEAYTYPNEFEPCLGRVEPGDGLYFDNQPKRRFSLCYRTLVNDDQSGGPTGYKIHFVYNLIASQKEVVRTSQSQTPEAVTFSWDVSSLPVLAKCEGHPPTRPVHSIIVDSRRSPPDFLEALEYRLLLGDFLTPCDLLDLFEQNTYTGRFLMLARHQSGETSNVVNYSDNDGWDWTDQLHTSHDIRTAVFTNAGRIIILGGDTSTDQISISEDKGESWLGEASGIVLPSSCVWSCIRQLANGRIVAISEFGIGSRCIVSDDNGDNWVGRSLPSGTWFDFVQLSTGRLVGVGGSGTHSMVSNNDGYNWSLQSALPNTMTLSSITLGQNDRLIAVARDGTGNRVVVSDDGGDTWSGRASVDNTNSWQRVITLSNGHLLALASTGTTRAMSSVDNGETWQPVTIPNYAWRHVVEGLPGRLVAVAMSGSGDHRVGVSDDYGVTWTTRAPTQRSGWSTVIHLL
jgi:hypothetical protein